MSDLLLDKDGDLPLRNQLVSGRQDTRQRIALRLSRHFGEWFLDLDAGLPFEAWMEQKPPDAPSIVARVRTEIGNVQGVVATQNFSSTHIDRVLRIEGEYLIGPDLVEELVLSRTEDETGNAAYFGLYFGSARPVGAPPHVGSYYDFGVYR